ncbi:hypothetical protein Y032_0047g1463 [Ancylostoma ceylanicum]|uniref:Uncharacterized protein n=1 Tax=Ancylostoma ceylanicum TaxID=53326 RepID=A0A016UCS1_9BILA|nr:hypothetical protein Y032_0047g1463 [Ancylostoma ceylanicum]
MLDCTGTIFTFSCRTKTQRTRIAADGHKNTTKMGSPNAYALPEPAVDEPDGCAKTDLPARTAPARDASRLVSRYTGPRFQPGLSWPD